MYEMTGMASNPEKRTTLTSVVSPDALCNFYFVSARKHSFELVTKIYY